MNIAKKIISAVCAFAMVTTVAATFSFAQIDKVPTLNVKQTSYDPETKTGVATVTITGLDTAIPSGVASDDFDMSGFEAAFYFNADKFDVSYYVSTGRPAPLGTNVVANTRISSKTTVGVKSYNGQANSMPTFVFSSDRCSADAISTYNKDDIANIVIGTINFKLKDGVDTATVEVKDVMIDSGVANSDYNDYATSCLFGTKVGCAEMNYNLETLGKAAATPTPTATATPTPTPTVEPTPEVTPEPVAGVEKFSDTDAAAWAWETAAVAGSKVKVTVTDGTTEGAKTFDLNAAVEGNVKVGVIVQYNPTAFPNFAIVDVEIQ